jgi:hypothetical protein
MACSCVHALAEDEQPRGDQAPGNKGLPEGIENRGPGQAAGKVGLAGAVQCAGNRGANRHASSDDDERPQRKKVRLNNSQSDQKNGPLFRLPV